MTATETRARRLILTRSPARNGLPAGWDELLEELNRLERERRDRERRPQPYDHGGRP